MKANVKRIAVMPDRSVRGYDTPDRMRAAITVVYASGHLAAMPKSGAAVATACLQTSRALL